MNMASEDLHSLEEAPRLERVARAFEAGRFEEAIGLLEPLACSGADPELFNNLGALFFQQGWMREAEDAFRRALRLDPAHPSAVANLTDQLIQEGLPHSALQVLRAAADAGAPAEVWSAKQSALEARHRVYKVSIYTPGYASEAFIDRCLRSIKAQTYPVHELLLVDDASPDRSTAIALEHGVRVSYHSENLGLAASCNTALEHCTGDFLAKIDTDLELDPTWLERAMWAFRNPEVAGVGGRLIEHRTATVPDQWRRLCMKQHWGDVQVVNPTGLFGADCIFRVEALRQVGGWNPAYRTNYEDFDLSNRLKQQGLALLYEPLACARHLRQDRLADVVRNCWSWQHPLRQDQGLYDRLEAVSGCLPLNRTAALNTLQGLLTLERPELLYPSFLLYYGWAFRDLQQVLRRRGAPAEEVGQTALGLLAVVRHQLRSTYLVPAVVVERTLSDLQSIAEGLMGPAERELWGREGGLQALVPFDLKAGSGTMRTIQQRLPLASVGYLEAFVKQSFLSTLGSGVGALLEGSVRRLIHEERQWEDPARPTYVVFNPPARKGSSHPGLQDGAAALRWLEPSRREAPIAQLEQGGARVVLVDAVTLQLDEREAHERVIGMEPAAVIYDASEGGLERIVASARYLGILSGGRLRRVLVGADASSTMLKDAPMFDEVCADWPEKPHVR